MTTISFNDATALSFTVAPRSPRASFAARLAKLQAAHDNSTHLNAIFGVAVRAAAAAVPVLAMGYLFVFV